SHAAAGVEYKDDEVRDLAFANLLADVPLLQAKGVPLGLGLFALDLMDGRGAHGRVKGEGVRLLLGHGAAHVSSDRISIRDAGPAPDALALRRLDEVGGYLPDAKGGPGLINPGRISLSGLIFFGHGSWLGGWRRGAFGALRLHL